jgi:hypothetical protein
MGGFRCRLGWYLGPGAVFKTAAPYSGFFLMVVVSVVLVSGLRLPGLLDSWSPGFLASSSWFWSGRCCKILAALVLLLACAGDARFVGSCRNHQPLLGLSRWRHALLVASDVGRSKFALFVGAASTRRKCC